MSGLDATQLGLLVAVMLASAVVFAPSMLRVGRPSG